MTTTDKTIYDITESELKIRLVEDRKWLFRAILAIWNSQTEDEQRNGITIHQNGVGFSAAHAKVGKIHGEMVRQFIINKQSLSYKQVMWIVKFWTNSSKRPTPRIWLYTKQLMEIIHQKKNTQNN